MKYTAKLPAFIYKKSFWEVIVALLFIALFIFFIKNERLELFRIREALTAAHFGYVALGMGITGVYILLQGALYIFSFKAIHQKIGLMSASVLFLKRNFISVFLPAGAFSSLAFFNKALDKYQITKTQIYYGSYLFGLCSLISVVVVAIPTLFFLFIRGGLRSLELYAFLFLIILVISLALAVVSVIRKGFLYQFLLNRKPDWALILEELQGQNFSTRQFINACLISVLIEGVGILHLYLAMLAIGAPPSWEVAIIGYIVMVIILIASPFLRGMGAIEVSMTYVLIRYGYDTVAAATTVLLFRLFEFWLPLLSGMFSFITRRGNFLVRVLPAMIILFLGIVNIISAITPAIPARMRLIETLLPAEVTQASNFAVVVFGIILTVLSAFLLLGARNAWKMGVLLTAASVLGHIVKGVDYEEAMVAAVALIALVATRKSYFVRHDIGFQQQTFTKIALAIGAVYIYVTVGFFFLQKQHFGIEYDLGASFAAFFKLFFLFDTEMFVPKTLFAKGFLYSIYALYAIFKPLRTQSEMDPEEVNLAREMVAQYGQSSLDYFKTYFDKLLFFNEAKTSFLAYRTSGHFAVVLEDPVGITEESIRQTISEFDQYCYETGLKSFYYRVSEEHLSLYHSLKKRSLVIGQEAVIDLASFTLEGGDKKSIRNALKKVENSGFHIRWYDPPIKDGLLQKIEQVSDEWLTVTGRTELVFTQGLFDANLLKSCVLFTVENEEEKVVAFANIVPDYNKSEGTYDLIRKSEDAPNGTLDYLMVKMFMYFKENGYSAVNLGLAPLAGIEKAENLTEQTIKFARDNFRQMSRFKGLYEYKDKFGPQWINKYLIYDNTYDLVQFPNALKEVSEIKV